MNGSVAQSNAYTVSVNVNGVGVLITSGTLGSPLAEQEAMTKRVSKGRNAKIHFRIQRLTTDIPRYHTLPICANNASPAGCISC